MCVITPEQCTGDRSILQLTLGFLWLAVVAYTQNVCRLPEIVLTLNRSYDFGWIKLKLTSGFTLHKKRLMWITFYIW